MQVAVQGAPIQVDYWRIHPQGLTAAARVQGLLFCPPFHAQIITRQAQELEVLPSLQATMV